MHLIEELEKYILEANISLKTEYPEWDTLVKEMVSDAFDLVDNEYELYASDVEEVETQSRDGFIPHTNGGYQARGFQDVYHAVGSGRYPQSDKVRTQIDYVVSENRQYAQDAFIDKHEADLLKLFKVEDREDLPLDKIDPHTLREMSDEYLSLLKKNYKDIDKTEQPVEKLADELDELEQKYEQEGDDTLMYMITAFYYEPGESHSSIPRDFNIDGDKKSMYVFGLINWEAPYHRHGKNREDTFYEAAFNFENTDDLKDKLKKELDTIVSKF